MNNHITTLSRERLEELSNWEYIGPINGDEIVEMARALLAAIDAKPDYYIHRVEVCDSYGPDVELRAFNDALDASKCKDDHGGELVELFTTPPAPSAPDGWKLVPVEPTMPMIDAAIEHHEGEAFLPV